MIFVRHPVPDAVPGLCYGRMDLGIGSDAPAQISNALGVIPTRRPIISSPARRCMALAAPLAERDAGMPHQDERLWEMNFGTWEGLMWDDVPRSQSDPWVEDLWNLAPPGGESFSTVCARVKAAISEAPEHAIIVAHAGVIRAAKVILLDHDIEQAFREQIPYAEPVVIERAHA